MRAVLYVSHERPLERLLMVPPVTPAKPGKTHPYHQRRRKRQVSKPIESAACQNTFLLPSCTQRHKSSIIYRLLAKTQKTNHKKFTEF